MIKKVSFCVGLLVSILAFFPSQLSGSEHDSLLSEDDLGMEVADHARGPALCSEVNDPKPWATYNQWMCFDVDQVQVEANELGTDNGWIPWAQIRVEAMGQSFAFSPEADLPIDAPRVMAEWRSGLQGSRQVCFYAAFLEYSALDPGQVPESLWVLQKIKTENGYWNVPEPRDELSDTDSDE